MATRQGPPEVLFAMPSKAEKTITADDRVACETGMIAWLPRLPGRSMFLSGAESDFTTDLDTLVLSYLLHTSASC